jgi:hypothetical protein
LTENPEQMLETMAHLDLDNFSSKKDQDLAGSIFDILN